MPAPSMDLRQRVIAAYRAKEGVVRQLAERFKVSNMHSEPSLHFG